jgi:thioredoxin reductase
MRFGCEVLEACRKAAGDRFLIGIRMPGDEMLEGGLSHEACIEIAKHHARTGLIDFISIVGGTAVDYQAEAKIWPTMWLPSAPYLELARAIKAAVAIPVFHATRITDAATAVYAVKEGYIDMVGMTRAFIADPHHVRKLAEYREAEIRPCVGAGYCVDRVLMGKDALCVHNVATGRELSIPQVLSSSNGPVRRILVVGGGPAGLEAARVCASRGHEVTLLEATGELGGQVVLAAKATWRRGLAGIVRWLAGEVDRLGVKVHFNRLAEAHDVIEVAPDVVIVATGGIPNVGQFAGSELATSIWDLLSGESEPGQSVLIYDESGGHASLSCAEFVAGRGSRVEIASRDKALGLEMSDTNYGAHMTELYKAQVTISPDMRLVRLSRTGNRLAAELRNTYSGAKSVCEVDQVIGDYGTLPNTSLYEELKPLSRNLGELDLQALAAARRQTIDRNPSGAFFLYRIGDAWAGRNIHAAMLDAMRVCQDL